MYSKLGIGWASSTLAFISIAFIPIPFVLYKVSRFSSLTRTMNPANSSNSMERSCAETIANTHAETYDSLAKLQLRHDTTIPK